MIEQLLLTMPTIDPAADAVESDGVWWTWGALQAIVETVLARLDEAGVPEGGRVGLLLRNRSAHLAALIACVISHRCAVAFNPVGPSAKIAGDITVQMPSIVIGAEYDLSDEVRDAARDAGIPVLLLIDSPGSTPIWQGGTRTAPAKSLEARAADTLIEMLSSGTTGPPKRIPLARATFNQSLSSAQALDRAQTESGPRLRSGVRLQTAPLSHMSGLFTALMTLAEGRKLALMEKFSVHAWADAVERVKPRIGNLPPAALRMILDAEIPRERLSSLAALRSGTAPVDPSIIDAFGERYGLPVLVQYGATEFSGSVAGWEVTAFKALYASKRGSVGKIQPSIEARVVDPETGDALPLGAHGVLELRGRQLGDPSMWVRTTDRASLDADQYLWIHGRADNAINRGGFKVHPDDVVAALQAHPSVREAVVVGLDDHRLGQVPAAAIVLAGDQVAPSPEELRAFLIERLAPYQIPSRYIFVDDLPRTPALKPALPEVRRLLEAR